MNILPDSASILVTENCNLRCTYCFEHHNDAKMSEEVAEQALYFLAHNAVKNNNDTFHAMIFGGEPLLNIDIIEYIFKRGLEIADELHVRFTSNIITNATVMNDHIFSVLKKYRDLVDLNIQLSVDGIQEVQDRYRVTINGKGSFHMVEKNIPRFQEIYDNNPDDRRLSIHGCVNHDTLPQLYNGYRFFKDILHFKQIWFLAIAEEDWTDDDVILYREECQKIYNDIIHDIRQQNNISIADYYAPFDKYRFCGQPMSLPCSAGRNYVTITAAGEIYPCHQIYFNDPDKTTKIGDIWNGVDDDKRRIFLEYSCDDISPCNQCNNTNCYRCLAANWMINGSILSPITGKHCAMAAIENEFQNKLKEEIEIMSLFSQTSTDCLCNMRDGNIPVMYNQDHCQSGNNPDNPDCLCDVRTVNQTQEPKENIIYDALELIIQQLEDLRQSVEELKRMKS